MSTRNKRNKANDLMTGREARQYAHPIASRELIQELLREHARPISYVALCDRLGYTNERDRQALARRLRAMEREGQLLKNRRGLYGLVQQMGMLRGRVIGHPDGFGFLTPEQGGEDLYLSSREMRQVLHGDLVLARVSARDRRGRQEATIVEILERRHHAIVGRYHTEGRIGFVAPEEKRISQDIQIPADETGGALEGQIVTAEITRQPDKRSAPIGRIVEVLGDHMAPGLEIEIALRKHELPYVWPPEIEQQSRTFALEVDAAEARQRRDLRPLPLVTIDGEDARDFDDAVYCEKNRNGWRLVVAIADVSFYVRPNDVFDKEAYNRGNSVYFPLRVIPMLPEVLSNELCSLKPDVDRLCMVCDMQISSTGKIDRYRFYEGVMRSHARLTYNQVAAMLVDRNAEMCKQFDKQLPHLQELYRLFKVLHRVRSRRGAIEFELPETRVVYDAHHKIKRIEPLVRNDAHRLIEECMLAANVCAAKFLHEQKIPALNRIHNGPDADKLADLREFLFELGVSLSGGDKPTAKDYAKLLEQIRSRPDDRLIQTVLLRSLSQACYSPEPIGHFALAYPHYAHFTSPIRRYPDLIVHRAIKRSLRKKPPALLLEAVQSLGEHCSMTERRADDATRDVVRWLKAEYMMDKIGEEFDGIISGVTDFGFFVELQSVFIDGLVHVTSLGNDYYQFDAAKHRLIGKRTRRVFRLGDPIRVKVVRVDLDEAKIDFELANSIRPRRTNQANRQVKRAQKKKRPPKNK